MASGRMNASVRYPNSPAYVATARRTAIEAARKLGLPAHKLDELGYAIGEALANAVEHGFRERTYFAVRVRHESRENAIVVDVEDVGGGFDPSEVSAPEVSAMRGYGLTIMRAMADRVAFERNGRLVRLWKFLESAACSDAAAEA
jgi:serine/threonine-protein kinase RsbW